MKKYILILAICGLSACTRYFKVEDRKSQTTAVTDSLPTTELSQKLATYLSPLHDSLDSKMGGVLAQSASRYEKRKPESELGNLLCDILLETALTKTGKVVDVAYTNSGGIRSELPAGGVTMGHIFTIMPFDNQMVVVKLSGKTMRKFLEFMAKTQDPQAGMKLVIDKNTNQIIEATIGGKSFDENAEYLIVTSDFVTNDADFWKESISIEPLNYLMRDAYIDYFRAKGKQGAVIEPRTDGRTKLRN